MRAAQTFGFLTMLVTAVASLRRSVVAIVLLSLELFGIGCVGESFLADDLREVRKRDGARLDLKILNFHSSNAL